MNALLLDRRSWLVAAVVVLLAAVAISNPLRPTGIKEVTVPEAKALIDAGAVVIDVRERNASAGSHVPNALLIPLEVLSTSLPKLEAYRDKPVVVYCGEGTNRGPEGTKILTDAGFTSAVNLKSGIEGWRAAGLPTKKS